ncbi:MAG: hypothetical protein WBG89_09010 [Ornithinimicrobium sp.]
MSKDEPVVKVKRVALFGGAILAFLIGSGFATGQEVLQYFTSYGYWGVFGGGLLVLVLITFVSTQFMMVGKTEQFSRPSQIYTYFGGRFLGPVLDYYSILFIFMSFMVMVAGAGAVVNQQYGLPTVVGGVSLAAVSAVTVFFGLNNLLQVIAKVGPAIVVIAIALGLWAILSNPAGIPNGQAALPDLEVTQASSNWVLAALSYVGVVMLWLAAFLTAMGESASSRREAWLGGVCGTAAFTVAVIIVALGLLANIEEVADLEIPMLYLAKDVASWLATGFSVIVVAGIFSTAVPLLWTVASRWVEDGSKKFRVLTLILAAVGCFLGLLVPFSQMVNIVYVINGYIGIAFLALMIFTAARHAFGGSSTTTGRDREEVAAHS